MDKIYSLISKVLFSKSILKQPILPPELNIWTGVGWSFIQSEVEMNIKFSNKSIEIIYHCIYIHPNTFYFLGIQISASPKANTQNI